MLDKEKYLKLIKEEFDPNLISALFKNFSNQYIALEELIDNAVDDRIDGTKLTISIDMSDEKIKIQNKDGRGMDLTDIEKFFKWGVSGKNAKIGRYGQGGKAAIGYLAKSFMIKSHPQDCEDSYLLKVDDWEDRSDGFKEFGVKKFDSYNKEEGSVIIELWNLKRGFHIKRIIERISLIYRPLILDGHIDIYINGQVVKCKKVDYAEGSENQFLIDIEFDKQHFALTGHYGMVTQESFKEGFRAGFNIYQYGRCVAIKEYFGHADAKSKWSYENLYGELYINFDLPLIMNKTDIDRDSELWQLIQQKMYDRIKKTETMVLLVSQRKPSSKEKSVIEKIGRKIKKKDEREDVDIVLANYGPHLLFKAEKDKNGQTLLRLNREHKAYQRWGNTAEGKRLYAVMIYSLFEAVEKLPKKEAAKFHNIFSASLKKHTHKLL